ncbi:MAG: AAA family ATPase [Candidatus Saccharimonadales bacterium]
MKSLNLAKPHLIVIVGVPGSGKTFFASQFSHTFNAPYLCTSDLLQFSNDERVLNGLWDFMLDKILQTKQTLLIEGTGAAISERRQLSERARNYGYQPLFVWVQTEPATAKQRATHGTTRLSVHEFNEHASQFQPLQASEPYMVISGKHTYASQAKNVLKKLVEPRIKSTRITPKQRPHAPNATPSTGRGRIMIN